MIILYFQESCLPNEYDWVMEDKLRTFRDMKKVFKLEKPKTDRFDYHKLLTKEIRYIPFFNHQCKIKATVNKLIIQKIHERHGQCNSLSMEY